MCFTSNTVLTCTSSPAVESMLPYAVDIGDDLPIHNDPLSLLAFWGVINEGPFNERCDLWHRTSPSPTWIFLVWARRGSWHPRPIHLAVAIAVRVLVAHKELYSVFRLCRLKSHSSNYGHIWLLWIDVPYNVSWRFMSSIRGRHSNTYLWTQPYSVVLPMDRPGGFPSDRPPQHPMAWMNIHKSVYSIDRQTKEM